MTLRLEGSLDHLRMVWQAGEAMLEQVRFEGDPEGSRYNVLLAVQEMLTNILRHGYQLDESQPVEVVMALAPEGFEVELRDRGPEFDPLAHDDTTVASREELPETGGGYGIYIAKMVMDELWYTREGGWNVLHMAVRTGAPARLAQGGGAGA